MATNFYYVYSLTDPRDPNPKPFYIGKGTGSRAQSHTVRPDSTRKGRRIQEILAAGRQPVVEATRRVHASSSMTVLDLVSDVPQGADRPHAGTAPRWSRRPPERADLRRASVTSHA